MVSSPTELVGEHMARESALFFTEALARVNARQLVSEQSEDSPCCGKCGGFGVERFGKIDVFYQVAGMARRPG